MGSNHIIKFNEELEFLSTSIIELVKIDGLSHENATVIFTTSQSPIQMMLG